MKGAVVIIPSLRIWQLRDCERIIIGNAALLGQDYLLIGVTRLHNEALVLPDTLSYVGKEVDAIIAYDDASADRTLDILRPHPKVALIVANGSWEEGIKERRAGGRAAPWTAAGDCAHPISFDWKIGAMRTQIIADSRRRHECPCGRALGEETTARECA